MINIDLNCDMGEGTGNDALLMPHISSANIACGYHGGDEAEMRRVISLCLQHQVAIGAHPSFPDRVNFGRTNMHLPKEELRTIVLDQLATISKSVQSAGGTLHHVKPHGALYNMAGVDSTLAGIIVNTVKEFDSSLVFYGLSGSVMIEEAVKAGLRVAREVFADRTYQPGGTLTPRGLPNALIESNDQALQQVLQIIQHQTATTANGESIPMRADTICIHGDGSHAVEYAICIRRGLLAAGIQIQKI